MWAVCALAYCTVGDDRVSHAYVACQKVLQGFAWTLQTVQWRAAGLPGSCSVTVSAQARLLMTGCCRQAALVPGMQGQAVPGAARGS